MPCGSTTGCTRSTGCWCTPRRTTRGRQQLAGPGHSATGVEVGITRPPTLPAVPVSAVIPHRNSGDLLEQCVDALLAARGVDEIVIADEDSTDGSVERVVDKPKVHVVE